MPLTWMPSSDLRGKRTWLNLKSQIAANVFRYAMNAQNVPVKAPPTQSYPLGKPPGQMTERVKCAGSRLTIVVFIDRQTGGDQDRSANGCDRQDVFPVPRSAHQDLVDAE